MNITRATLLLSLGLTACATPAQRTLVLKSDARLLGGVETKAKIEAPGDWYQASGKADRAELKSSDNFSSISFAVSPVVAEGSRCPEFALRAATDAAKAVSASVKPELAAANEAVEWRMTVPAATPGPSDRFVQGRTVCRSGALASVTCSTGVNQKETTGAVCKKVLDSLVVEPAAACATVPAEGAAAAEKPAEMPAEKPAETPAADAPKAP